MEAVGATKEVFTCNEAAPGEPPQSSLAEAGSKWGGGMALVHPGWRARSYEAQGLKLSWPMQAGKCAGACHLEEKDVQKLKPDP